MTRSGEGRPRLAAGVAGSVIILDALLARLLLRADAAQVYWLNHPVVATCAFRRQTGLPCPTCGMTRSIVLFLHGELGRAWILAPAGPVLMVGLLAAAVALLVFAAGGARSRWLVEGRTRFWLQRGGLLYAAATLAIWLGGWIAQFRIAWHAQ